jgi:hypothetical protein
MFLRGFDIYAVTSLLSEIVDPRWYVDTAAPDRLTRLHSFLGLWPRFFQAMCRGDTYADPHFYRAVMSITSWAGRMPPEEKPYHQYTYNFLWRFLNERVLSDKKLEATSLLRTTQLFISFLRDVWLNQISDAELFIPEYFFKRPEDADAYKQMVGNLYDPGNV